MRAYNGLVSGPKFTEFFSSNVVGVVVNQLFFSDFQYLNPFWRYAQLKSEVVQNRTVFWTCFALPNFRGAGPPKFVPKLSCLPRVTSRGKVS